MTTYYKKEGRRYVPTLEYDSNVLDAFAEGAHIVVCKPGHRMYKYKIQPEFAGLIAAGMYCRDAISSKVINSAQVRPGLSLSTEEQAALDYFKSLSPTKFSMLTWPSANEIAESATVAMQEELAELLKNPAVKTAYEHFLLMCKLATEENSTN